MCLFSEQSFQAELDSESSPVKSVNNTLISSTETSYASAVDDNEQINKDTTLTNQEGGSVTNQLDEEEMVRTLVDPQLKVALFRFDT